MSKRKADFDTPEKAKRPKMSGPIITRKMKKKNMKKKSFLLKGKLALLSVHHFTVIGTSKYSNIH